MNALLLVLTVALVTAALRLLPVYLLGRKGQALPPAWAWLTARLPGAVIGLLVVYSLKDTSLSASPHGLPEALGVLCAALLQYCKKNTLLSVGLSTALYMALIRLL